MPRKKQKAQIRIPRALRRGVRPWKETRRKEILGAIKKAKAVAEVGAVDLAGALLGVAKTAMYKALKEYRTER